MLRCERGHAARLCAVALMAASVSNARTWTSKAGAQVEAEFDGVEYGKVVLRQPDGSRIGILEHLLVEEDRDYIRRIQEEAAMEPKREEAREAARECTDRAEEELSELVEKRAKNQLSPPQFVLEQNEAFQDFMDECSGLIDILPPLEQAEVLLTALRDLRAKALIRVPVLVSHRQETLASFIEECRSTQEEAPYKTSENVLRGLKQLRTQDLIDPSQYNLAMDAEFDRLLRSHKAAGAKAKTEAEFKAFITELQKKILITPRHGSRVLN